MVGNFYLERVLAAILLFYEKLDKEFRPVMTLYNVIYIVTAVL
jgi:hypothetical protein